VVGAHAVGRSRTTFPGGLRVTGGDATSHVEGAVWRLWFSARPEGEPSVVGGPPRQAPPPKYLQPGPRAGTRPTRCGSGRLDLT